MRLKLFATPILALSLSFVRPAFSQVAAAAYQGRSLPITVGAGVSTMNIDWGANNRMIGGTLWIDYFPAQLPPILNGLGIDVEARDVNYDRPAALPSNFRQDTVAGGPIYTWNHFRNFQIYGKGLIGFGSFDFRVTQNPNYTHDTRTVYAPGGGLLARAYKNLWFRADYEYQFWPNLLANTDNPQGFTVGAVYDFRGPRR